MHYRGLRAPHVPKRACGIRAHKPHPLSRFLDLEQMLSCRAIDKNLSSGGQDGYNTPSCGWGGGAYLPTAWAHDPITDTLYNPIANISSLKVRLCKRISSGGAVFPRHWPRAEIRPQVLLVLAPLFACLNNGNPGDDSLGKLPVFQKDRRCGRKQRRYRAITNKNEGEREKIREDKRRDN